MELLAMNSKLSPLIEAEDLLVIYKDKNLVLLDASNGKDAEHHYRNRHLDGALFVNLNSDLAETTGEFSQGGRHPLPSIQAFATTLTRLGILIAMLLFTIILAEPMRLHDFGGC